jgi:hypothetical protein
VYEQPLSHTTGLRIISLHPDRADSQHCSFDIVFVCVGASMAKVSGELFLKNGIRLVVRERLVFDRLPLVIDFYGYEVWRGDKKLYWYDSQPHPGEPSLQSSHPHHKHIPPDIKHHRIPAPEMSFVQPNIPALVADAESLPVQSIE